MHEEKLLMDIFFNPEVVPHFVSYAFLASILLIVLALIVRSSLKLVPKGTQNVVETIIEALLNLAEDNIGHHWARPLFPLIATLALFIATCNFMGLIPGFSSPTSNINTNAAMAIPVFLATHVYGIWVHGFGYVKHFLGPIRSIFALPLMILMFVIEFIGHIARPLTLSVRLFGNMSAKHYILGVLGILAPAVVPVAILVLGVLVSVIQAFVFTLLTALYLAGAVEEAH
ncbi:ATP synthase subunit a [Candidatus Sulfobium mesophilum]|uniref:ATP synthase subunit a n=1 Tax=Candidatus Sulfobium mesophilum TaxID=2016548 RepID=A0A2U3QGU3_9BACT|nr:ATP synthase subunit a [Candidatus Sulfobium mesophilum]